MNDLPTIRDAPPISDARINELIYTCLPSVMVHPDQLMVAWCEILGDTQNALAELRQWRIIDRAREHVHNEAIRVLRAKIDASDEKIEAGQRQIDEAVARVNELMKDFEEPT